MVNRRSVLAAAPAALVAAAAPAAADQQQRHYDRVTPGADRLAERGWRDFQGRKVGVLTNPTGVLRDKTHIVDSLVSAGMAPVAVFGPEHGFRGTAQAGGSEGSYVDPRTKVPVYDAYGVTATKLAEMYRKAGVDTIVFDIADVGSRFYTYIWSMYTAMVAAAETGAAFVVLDRPNPVGGKAYGPMLDPAFASGVGRKPIVQQHGMTAGELARFFNKEFLPADTGGRQLSKLDVVEVRGWRRDTLFARTGLDWIPPSPNMPLPQTALAYPGTCLFEGTVFSEGRGTTRPFETIGAPDLDWRWAEELNRLRLPGARFRETYFAPTFNKFAGKTCGGVQLHFTDEESFDPIRTAVAMLVTAKRLYPTIFAWRGDNFVDKLSGSARLRTMIDSGAGVDDVVGAWREELAGFGRQRRQHLIYW
ncbi:uncharacterized protein YbbC (DUF1343 family) [Kibdelosporangium banguiense]|uniref:Uncharacterized protein YbbC (DUF1343 family) n=1 Tax=Kibdelosporangium banguiense TaxID=1365924 RepID=A0ABS4TAI5_9PSEU|nr:DUF1343 domain-containing protein [Kibdelosporangium banguiense]MBP2321435.1 uncharacterized protein YbbC (DUF1343 family) [Kibdelosporangium banguiense]